METTTIAAIATPLAVSGIGVVRLSGPRAIEIAAALIRPVGKRRVEDLAGYTGLLGRVHDAQGDFDDAVLFVYRSPKSYTGEDVAEICCHGGAYLLQRVLRRCITLGCEPAQRGEFTRRAFQAGKLTLTQAEAVASLIASGGRQSAALALAARDGAIFRAIASIKDALVFQSASLAAWIDYPEEEQEEVFAQALQEALETAFDRLQDLLQNYDKGKQVMEGVSAAIIGRPNVGKSALMNLLSGEEKSIVTAFAGTTRDVVESTVTLGGVVLRLCDTAGIRSTEDPVEAAGVALARRRLERAQLLLVVLDGSGALSGEDMELLRSLSDKPAVAVLNKSDLGTAADAEAVRPYVRRTVSVSALTGAGVKELERAVLEVLELDGLDDAQAVLVSERQRIQAAAAAEQLREALDALAGGVTLDAVNVCLDCAIDALLELTGERASEAVVNEVFSKFCVGK